MSIDFQEALKKLILERLSKSINISENDTLLKNAKNSLVDKSTRKLGYSKLTSNTMRP